MDFMSRPVARANASASVAKSTPTTDTLAAANPAPIASPTRDMFSILMKRQVNYARATSDRTHRTTKFLVSLFLACHFEMEKC